MEITDNEGLPVVYDGVGKVTLENSLGCLRMRGMMVSFGNALPKETIIPLILKQPKEFSRVTFPTPSYTTGNPSLSVISITLSLKFSFV